MINLKPFLIAQPALRSPSPDLLRRSKAFIPLGLPCSASRCEMTVPENLSYISLCSCALLQIFTPSPSQEGGQALVFCELLTFPLQGKAQIDQISRRQLNFCCFCLQKPRLMEAEKVAPATVFVLVGGGVRKQGALNRKGKET